jgi:hypothetical protein
MRIEYKSRTGNFNLCNPNEKSVSCNIKIIDENGQSILQTNINPDSELEGCDVDDIIYYLEEADKKVLYSTRQKEWKEMVDFLVKNKEEIERGNKEYRISKIKNQLKKLQEELNLLSSSPSPVKEGNKK